MLLGISRSSVYYAPRGESAENLALLRRMDALSLQYPFYGSRQMARHLRREGVAAGRRRVRRLMRLMGLEAIYRKPRTSDAQPDHHVYPSLLRELKIDRPDQVWCADITYIPVTTSCIPSFCKHQITPKTSRYTRCSMSMFPNAFINGRIRSSGQLGRWWYSISPWRNNECVRRFTVFAFNQRS